MPFKKIKYLILLICLHFANISISHAQDLLISKNLEVIDSVLCLNEKLIDWSSIKIYSEQLLLLNKKDYQLGNTDSCIQFFGDVKKVNVTYRLLDLKTLDSFYHKDRRRILLSLNDGLTEKNDFNNKDNIDPYDLFQGSKLNTYGNMSRGLGFGNSQNLVVNSNFNLQINGDLGNDIKLIAAISDESNPIQPEGNTQQLQDFDQVYLKFLRRKSELTVGDFLLNSNRSNYFMVYNKKSRGANYAGVSRLSRGELATNASAAVSRGRFSRNTIEGVEGNQGPYQLRGKNGELFILILAGTERIYLDGKLLQRGENHDYIINYNLGEITFTATSLITSFSRIVAEFQYSDRNYSRVMTALETNYTSGRWNLRAGYFLEKDNKNQPFQQSLDVYDSSKNLSARQILQLAGDNPNQASLESFTENESFKFDRVNYRKIDTLGALDVYVYTPSPLTSAVYFQVSFSFVGKGNGDYVNTNTSANGRVYEYIEPVLGTSVGDYAPIITLVSPTKQQMVIGGLTYSSQKDLVVDVEIAGSNLDKNTFSSLDAQDDNGWASAVTIKNTKRFKKLDSTSNLKTVVKYEHKNKDFNFIERYRPVEFNRNWNRKLSNPEEDIGPANEDVIFLENRFNKGRNFSITSQFNSFLRTKVFNGFSHNLKFDYRLKGFELTGLNTITNSQNKLGFKEKNDFFEHGLELAKRIKRSKVGVGYLNQESSFLYDSSDNMGLSSYQYQSNYFYINLPYKESNVLEVKGELRKDKRPVNEGFEDFSTSKNLTLHYSTSSNYKNRLEADFTYRSFALSDSFKTTGQNEDNLLSKLQYNFKWFEKAVMGNTFLHIGTGREQRREYTYLEVPSGNGYYTWNDYNSNGIKELNEFEEAFFQDQANYIRIIIPTNDFIKSNTNEFNQTLKLKTPKDWARGNGLKKFMFRFSSVSAWRIARKMTDNNFVKLVNPFENDIENTSLIYTKSFVKHTLFFNRLSPIYALELTTISNKDKTFINNGFDSRREELYKFKTRLNLNSKISLLNEVQIGDKGFGSDFFPTRDYHYDYYKVIPSLSWVFNRNFRTNLSYTYYHAQNRKEFGLENTSNDEFALQLVYNALQKGNIDATFRYTEVKYDGVEGNTLSYDMLKGLTDGKNLRWVLGIGKRFSNHMQLRLEYNGRQIGNNSVVHLGNVQARYLF